MAMSPEAQAEYNKALTAAVLKHGTMVSKDASSYGWEDYEYHHGPNWSGRHKSHHVTCGWASVGKPEEDYWHEFQGTFYEGDTSVHGIVIKGLTCNCGRIQDREMRWQASIQTVAEAIFEEAFSKKNEEKPTSKCPGPPHKGHASSDWTCPYDAD